MKKQLRFDDIYKSSFGKGYKIGNQYFTEDNMKLAVLEYNLIMKGIS